MMKFSVYRCPVTLCNVSLDRVSARLCTRMDQLITAAENWPVSVPLCMCTSTDTHYTYVGKNQFKMQHEIQDFVHDKTMFSGVLVIFFV